MRYFRCSIQVYLRCIIIQLFQESKKGVDMKTDIIVKEDCVVLSRFIDRKLYNIEFAIDVKCADVAAYFNMSDDLFKQFVRREGI